MIALLSRRFLSSAAFLANAWRFFSSAACFANSWRFFSFSTFILTRELCQ